MYATIDDLQKRLSRFYAELYADAAGNPDASLMTEDLTAATAEIDGSVAARYQTPVTAADALPLLKSWCLTLVEEIAWSRSGRDELPENVVARAKTVREQLKRVGEGAFRLPAAPAETTSGQGGAAILSIAEPVFTREKMSGF
jgi:phage gp36-like protein